MNQNIKKIKLYKDFKKIIQVFKEPPFKEVLTNKDILTEYKSYLTNGIAYGYYKENEIIGFIGILKGIQENHPIENFNPNKVLYINGVAVINDYRKQGIGTKLLNYSLKEIDLYKFVAVYLRTNYKNSKLVNIALNSGFKKVTKDGKIITEDVKFKRNTGEITSDKRMFMIKTLK